MAAVQNSAANPASATAAASGNYTASTLSGFNGTATGDSGAFTQLGSLQGWNASLATEPQDNLPFDYRINRQKLRGGAQIQGGLISTTSPVAGATNASGTNIFTCYFLFNPTEIDLEYSFDTTVTGALNPIFVANGATTNTQGLMLNQTQSFTLLFDRTYDLWAGKNGLNYANCLNGGPYTFGAQWDVWAIERLVGVYGQASGQGPSGPPAGSICTVQFGGAGVQNSQTGYLTLGDTGASTATIQPWVNFNGWMTEFQVEYTRFDSNMVPSRAAVSLSFMQVYSQPVSYNTAPQDQTFGSGGGNGSSGTGAAASQSPVGSTENLPGGTGAPTFTPPVAIQEQEADNTPGLQL